MNRGLRDKLLEVGLSSVWIIIAIIFVSVAFIIPRVSFKDKEKTGGALLSKKSQEEVDEEEDKKEGEKNLIVYSNDKSSFRMWKRDDAIRFAFDNVANTINYLFVAASVLLGLIGKFSIDPILDDKKKMLVRSNTVLIMLKHAAIGCLISIAYGFIANSYFAGVADQLDFSIYDEVRASTVCQMLSLLSAALLVMLVIKSIVNENLKLRIKENSK